jgi:glycosyltransferase involved in cell wall biosynthesis
VSPSSWLLGEHEKRKFFSRSEKAVIPNPAPDPAGRGVSVRQTGRIDNGARIDKRFRFLYVGQIEKHKGIDLLLAAFSPIAERTSGEAALTLVGGGSGFDSVRRDYSARQNIYFIGRRSREEVMASMAACDCLIVPSVCYENSPAVIYEAFSAGLPVMAAGIGGIGELLAEGRGLTFEPGSVESLRVKMDWALGNAEELRRMGSRGRDFVRDLGADSYARKIYSLI